ncbi:MAG TPA: hypothetical protein VKS44_14270, partial [Candidatus Acidoferrales bacterium]|nr:hypothetical protein [Candidatus Acidoferrales bacterium]
LLVALSTLKGTDRIRKSDSRFDLRGRITMAYAKVSPAARFVKRSPFSKKPAKGRPVQRFCGIETGAAGD